MTIVVSRDTLHKTCGQWYFQPSPDVCIPVSAGRIEKVTRGEYEISAELEYTKGKAPARTSNPDSPAYSDPGYGPEVEVSIGREYVPLTDSQKDEIAYQVDNDERPTLFMTEYEGAPHPEQIKSEIAGLKALHLLFYLSRTIDSPWIFPFAYRRLRYLANRDRAEPKA